MRDLSSKVSGIKLLSSSNGVTASSHVRSILMRNESSVTKEYSMVEGENVTSSSQVLTNYNLIKGDDFLNQDVSNDSKESGENMSKDVIHFGRDVELEGNFCKTKWIVQLRALRKKDPVPRNKRILKMKETSGMDGENKAALQRQNSVSCCSENIY
ncbi:hypothetical protein CQW23_23802 [Capsicum baccatum]|uniref:Uncharacterized protein n=1 Tax=Capsicum baccatum TaxID=33114 RepID=A0A2G2VT12_CAPBA|nr:hypothetical protein CQW23_23802 [Capsicum baccatum]